MIRSISVVAAGLLALVAASPVAHADVPEVPLETSAPCTSNSEGGVGLAVSDGGRATVTGRDRNARHIASRATPHSRALGRSLVRERRPARLGLDADTRGARYLVARTPDGDVIYRVRGTGRTLAVSVLQVLSPPAGAWISIFDIDLPHLDRATATARATTWPGIADIVVGDDVLYASVPDEHRVVAVALDRGTDRFGRDAATVWDHVIADGNAPWAFAPLTSEDSFSYPSQLALDAGGNLYIAESVDADPRLKTRGDDVWVAAAAQEPGEPSPTVSRLAGLEDCAATIVGLEADRGDALYLRVQRIRDFFGLVLKN